MNADLDDLEVVEGLVELAAAQAAALQTLREVRARYDQLARDHTSLRLVLAHEVRNPLTAVLATLDTVTTRELAAAEADQLLVAARRQAHQLHELVEDLLSVGDGTAPEAARMPLEEVSLREVITDVQVSLAERVAPERIAIRIDPAIRVLTAPPRLRRIVSNLVVNAAKHSPAHAPVEVRAELLDGVLRVEVHDRGDGIPSEHVDALFEPFRRGAGATESGLGLGLYVVQALARSLGGDVRLLERVGGGTRAIVTLPQQRATDPAASPATGTATIDLRTEGAAG